MQCKRTDLATWPSLFAPDKNNIHADGMLYICKEHNIKWCAECRAKITITHVPQEDILGSVKYPDHPGYCVKCIVSLDDNYKHDPCSNNNTNYQAYLLEKFKIKWTLTA